MILHATTYLEFKDIPSATPFLLMLRPRNAFYQKIRHEQFTLSSPVLASEFLDPFGNRCQRIMAPKGYFTIFASVEAECSEFAESDVEAPFIAVQDLPEYTLPFLLPSRYCESDRFGELAQSITSGVLSGYNQCLAIVNYIQQTIQYSPGSGQQIISACEVNEHSEAVCRDMAHLGIALCRALAIPARLVVGYLETCEPMDLHAWFEAYVGNCWYTFDPTQQSLKGGRIIIAHGRDAADVAIYTQFGTPVELSEMKVTVESKVS